MTTTKPSEPEPLMSIGLFSRSSLLSVKALRSYHDQGILVPAAVDPDTGYRSYHPGQLTDATVLASLRRLDLPLASVKQILESRDPETTRSVLASHHLQMTERLSQTQHIVDQLQQAVRWPGEQTPVHIRTLDNQHALCVSADVASEEFPDFFAKAFPLLFDSATRHKMSISGPGAALYQPVIHDHDSEPVTAYIPIEHPDCIPEPSQGLSIIELPAQTVAALTHHGSYDNISQSYANLGHWIAHHDIDTDKESKVREIYSISVDDTSDPSEYRTDICWPVNTPPQTKAEQQ